MIRNVSGAIPGRFFGGLLLNVIKKLFYIEFPTSVFFVIYEAFNEQS